MRAVFQNNLKHRPFFGPHYPTRYDGRAIKSQFRSDPLRAHVLDDLNGLNPSTGLRINSAQRLNGLNTLRVSKLFLEDSGLFRSCTGSCSNRRFL